MYLLAEFKSNCIFLLFYLVSVFLILKSLILKLWFKLGWCSWKRMNQSKTVPLWVLGLQRGSEASKTACVGSPGGLGALDVPKKWSDIVRKQHLGTVSCQAAKQLCAGCQIPAFSQGRHQSVLLPQEAGGWEHCHCWDRCTGKMFAKEYVSHRWTHLESKIWGTGSSQQQGRESFSWPLAAGKRDPGTETEAGPALFGDQQRGGRWGRGGKLHVHLREKTANEFWVKDWELSVSRSLWSWVC